MSSLYIQQPQPMTQNPSPFDTVGHRQHDYLIPTQIPPDMRLEDWFKAHFSVILSPSGAKSIIGTNSKRWNATIEASFEGNLHVLQRLLQEFVGLNVEDSEGKDSVASLAVVGGHTALFLWKCNQIAILKGIHVAETFSMGPNRLDLLFLKTIQVEIVNIILSHHSSDLSLKLRSPGKFNEGTREHRERMTILNAVWAGASFRSDLIDLICSVSHEDVWYPLEYTSTAISLEASVMPRASCAGWLKYFFQSDQDDPSFVFPDSLWPTLTTSEGFRALNQLSPHSHATNLLAKKINFGNIPACFCENRSISASLPISSCCFDVSSWVLLLRLIPLSMTTLRSSGVTSHHQVRPSPHRPPSSRRT